MMTYSERIQAAIAEVDKAISILRDAPQLGVIQVLIVEAVLTKESLQDLLPESTVDERDDPNDLLQHGFND
jgi:hypothetical protein